MLNDSFYKKLPNLCLSAEVKQLCASLFQSINASYFDYCRVYDDNSCLILSSDGDWLEHFFKQKYGLGATIKHDGKHLWSSYYYSPAVQDARINFNYDHGISIFYKRDNFIENFDIAAPRLNREIVSLYLNEFERVENFIQEFMEKASPLILQSEQQLIKLPEQMIGLPSSDTPCLQGISLSKREYQCLELLFKGYTAKETGKQLSLSHRTVEEYFISLKNKFDCRHKRELLKIFENNNEINCF